jgi:hypothetical protein
MRLRLRELILRFDKWDSKFYLHYFEYKKRKIQQYKLLFEEYIAGVRAESWPARMGIAHEWYRDYFYFTKTAPVDLFEMDSCSVFSVPKYFYTKLNKAIKIPNINEHEILRHYWYMSLYFFAFIITYPISAFILNYWGYGGMNDIIFIGYISFLIPGFILLFLFTVEVNTLSKIVPVPFIIFDNDINSLLFAFNGVNQIIPYQQVAFNVRQIEDSPAYCALEMEINYSDKSAKKIIMEFCESHFEAQSVLNTYRALISGDEAIYHKKLKRYSSSLSDFNMPWWQGICHFFRTTTNWHACVFPHYFGFRLRYGHPMGVLKKYIIEQELKKPLKIK